ncbi:unnamed protein product [Notodromas monacha]|uniref:isoleucine--tRNA ligase n=1 Tax=Notodromas monacha TaxID=399045 RepID=A0A7R9GGC8_9CRUS|nr:unnamed protein product [Notodromas monacha]CAG0921692.1 unnamed protein product [Notodromas monacha]
MAGISCQGYCRAGLSCPGLSSRGDRRDFVGCKYSPPLKRSGLRSFLAADHVTSDKGTGFVHTAPAHGHDDFLVALKHSLPLECYVNEEGEFVPECPVQELLAKKVLGGEADDVVLNLLGDDVLKVGKLTHSYPYDWRSKTPIIIRASQQWFFDTQKVRSQALEVLDEIQVRPRNQEQGMKAQLKSRPYWCISRQRCWGVPIPALYSKTTGEAFVSRDITESIKSAIDTFGLDAWWQLEASKFAPSSLLKKSPDVALGRDILDIWFDSGVSWACHSKEQTEKRADVYLEGVDQFGGWFQSSLLTSVAMRNVAPYKKLLVHGFVVDETGRKMSKSLGNVVDPKSILKGRKGEAAYGIDVWWAVNYGCDESRIRIGAGILAEVDKDLDKSRNVLKFLLGTLNDFHPDEITLTYEELKVVDKYLLHLVADFEQRCLRLYDEWMVDRVANLSSQFLQDAVSACVHWMKDRLYCENEDSASRVSAQFSIYQALFRFLQIIGPIVPHLAEEAWSFLPPSSNLSDRLFKSVLKPLPTQWYNEEVLKAIETAEEVRRLATNISGHIPLMQQDVNIFAGDDVGRKLSILQKEEASSFSDLCEVLQAAKCCLVINGKCEEQFGEVPGAAKGEGFIVHVKLAKTSRCPRCRKYCAEEVGLLCSRCSSIVSKIGGSVREKHSGY